MRARHAFLIALAPALLGACAHSPSGQSYPSYGTRTSYDVEYGEVVDVREVRIEGESSFLGTWGGAEVGRAVAGTRDHGRTRYLTRAVGAVAGAVAGRAVERKVTEQQGLEITVLLDSSDTIAVVQAADVEFVAGDRVRVLFGQDGSARVSGL